MNKILIKKLDIFVIIYLDNILVYTKDPGQLHIDVVPWVLGRLQRYNFFTNLKKYRFYQDDVWFLGFVILAQDISIEEKKIEVVQT